MRIDGRIVVPALTTWLPPQRDPVAGAVRCGYLSPADAAGSGYIELPIAADVAPPEMAVLAGRAALERAGLPAGRLRLTVHAWTYHQGHDFWSPAHYVASHVGAPEAEPIGVQQMCNGGAAAFDIAITRLLADARDAHALVTTADRFVGPGFDRWRGDYGVLYGDGATAAVVSRADATRSPAALELLATVTRAAADMERMHRGEAPFGAAPMINGPIDVRRTKKAYLAAEGKESFVRAVGQNVQHLVRSALDESGVDAGEVRLVTVPRLGGASLHEVYLPALRGVLPVEPVDLGAGTGHLGAGDVLANLAAVVDGELLEPGEVGLALSAGAGFTWSCLVVRRSADHDLEDRSQR